MARNLTLPGRPTATVRRMVRSGPRLTALSAASVATRLLPSRSDGLAPPPAGSGLIAVSGDPGPPGVGYTFAYMSDPILWMRRRYERHGAVSWSRAFGIVLVSVCGGEGIETVLLNRDRAYSQSGWEYFIGPFFRRGLMLLDADEHLHHRRIMQQAFARPRLTAYTTRLGASVAERLDGWETGPRVRLYPRLKQLSLDVATDVFMGGSLGPEADRINAAFIATVKAGTAFVRTPMPGGRWAAGLRGRAVLEEFFRARLAAKRDSDGDDLFAALCHAESEDGERFTDDDVVNHMIFLMMAAHDTSTITSSVVAYQLARRPDWQERLRAESLRLGDPAPDLDGLDRLTALDLVIKACLRLVPPVPGMMRRTVRDTELLGRHIPGGTIVNVVPWFNHFMSEYWSRPDEFDPERFAEPRREDRSHRYAWMPFGGGVHKCIGMHFGMLEVKLFLHQLLLRYRWSVPAGYEMPLDTRSLPVPADGLPLTLSPR